MNFRPARPVGNSNEARYMQWVWDQLVIHGRLIDTPEIQFSHTTTGIVPKVKPQRRGGSSTNTSAPVWL